MSDQPTRPVRVVSFGYVHTARPPAADLTLDVRRVLRDPARVRDAGLLDATGLDPAVRRLVLTTPGADVVLLAARLFATGMARHDKPVTVAFGCAGGRHRSVALAEALAADLTHVLGIPTQITHLHLHLPRVPTTTDQADTDTDTDTDIDQGGTP